MPAASSEERDYGVIREQFHTLIAAVRNKLEREFPVERAGHPGSRPLLVGLYRSAENVNSAIRSLLADEPASGGKHREYAPAVAPLTRALVDALCNLLFVFQDLPANTAWFFKSGWRDSALEAERLKKLYAQDPSWAAFLSRLDKKLAATREQYGVTISEAANPRKGIAAWPIPGAMKSHRSLGRERREFIEYLYDWHYRVLSQDAHLNLIGIMRRAPLFVPKVDADERRTRLESVRTMHVTTSIALMLAIITEIEFECKFGLLERIRYVWTVVASWDEDTKQLYERFFTPILQRAGVK